MAYTFTMTTDEVDKACGNIVVRAKNLRIDIHKVAVSILHNWAVNGSVNVAAAQATKLLNSVDSSHAQKVVNWFGVHAGFELIDVDGDKAFGYDADRTTIEADDFQAAKAESMFDLTPDKKPEPYDLIPKLMAFIEAAEKRAAKSKAGDNIPADKLAALKALVV